MSIKEIIAAVIIIALLTGLSIPLLMGKGGVILVRKFTTFRNEEEKQAALLEFIAKHHPAEQYRDTAKQWVEALQKQGASGES